MSIVAQVGGQIVGAIAKVRTFLDEPVLRAKYSDQLILDLLAETWCEVLTDLYNLAENVPVTRFDVTLTVGQSDYVLPANVGEILRVARLDANNLPSWEFKPRCYINPIGFGIRFEGSQRFVLNPPPQGSGDVVSVEYIPAGDAPLLKGTVQCSKCTRSTIQLSAVGTQLGTLDRRPNAYLGAYLSVFKATNQEGSEDRAPTGYQVFPIQERVITGFDPATSTITVSPAFDFDLAAAVALDTWYVFEIYPIEAASVWSCMIYRTAAKIAAIETKTTRYNMLNGLAQRAQRATALRWANMQTRAGAAFQSDTPENHEYLESW